MSPTSRRAPQATAAETPAVVIVPANPVASGQHADTPAATNVLKTTGGRRPRVGTACGSARHVLSELVCLRALDSRRCAAADAAHGRRRGAEVVVLEIPARRRTGSSGGQDSGSASAAQEAKATTVPVPITAELASAVLASLAAAGISAAHDVCAKGETPGSRFFAWEAAGVPLRVEVGEREASGLAVTLAVHPALVDAELIACMAVRTELSGLQPDAAAPTAVCGQALRLGPVPAVQVAAVCRTILEIAAGLTPSAPDAPPLPRPVLLPHGHCPKLHLWPDATPRPCAVHVRHLLHAGPPCHCRVAPHPSMSALREEVSVALARTGRVVAQWEHADGPPPMPPTTTLFVSGLPSEAGVGALQRALTGALQPYGLVRVQVAVGARGRPRGWARAVVQTPKAEAAIIDLDGILEIEGRAGVSMSHATGRADALFSRLPFDVRCRLRIDDVAAFSVMDDTSGESMAALAAAITAAASGLQPPPLLSQGDQPAASCGQSASLALSCADITACCGGTTMALARMFDRVTAVEIDQERCNDLAHNLTVAGMRVQRVSESELPAWCGHSSGAAAVGCSVSREQAAAGGVAVLCGDAVALLERLGPHDCFVVDPPWGGPSYLQQGDINQQGGSSSGGVSGEREQLVSSRGIEPGDQDGSGVDVGVENLSDLQSTAEAATGDEMQPQPGAARKAVADMPLGGQSLVHLCVRLAAVARVALLRLPSRGFDFEAFAEAVVAGCENIAAADGSVGAEQPGFKCGSPGACGSSCATSAPLILSSELGRSQLLLVVYGGAISAIEPPATCRPDSRSSRCQWQLRASSSVQQQQQPEIVWPLPEPCRVFDRHTQRFVRCERVVRC